ncbi:Tn4651 auxiliary cointegrate resolution protein T [hydrothermal vent metagenome]|uniref:Tn4651 auxiliary cointegrate resolution protein T n=1 Tax=hydrothermal vent metagenome TaxID=652676 RepID=A0A3B0XEE6_9ZZZZ
MARAGINYIDVTKAAQAIQDKGQNPTVDRVLAHLGTGSKSTIAPLLKQWKIEQGQVVDAAGLPDDILKAVKGIHERLQQSAEVKIEQAMEESLAQISVTKDALEAATAQIEKIKQYNEQLKTQLESSKADNIELRDKLEAEHITVARLTSGNEALASQLDQAKSDINEQKQETLHIRESFEHYQTQAAEDRQLEREQYQVSKRQLEERIQATNQQLSIELKRSEQFSTEKQQISDQVKQLRKELDQIKEDLQVQKLKANDLIQKLETKEKQLVALQQSNQDLNSKHNAYISENSNLQTAKKLLEREIEQLKISLSETNDKALILSDENKIILQEKAMLHGQFKQLQDSI